MRCAFNDLRGENALVVEVAMGRSRALGAVTAALVLGIWSCTAVSEKSEPQTRSTSNAQTAIDWRYGICPENSPPPDPTRCGFPPGAVNGTPTTYHLEVTCASLGIGSTATTIDVNAPSTSDEELIAGRQFDLAGGNKVILWQPEGLFWASSTAIDAVVVRLTGEDGPSVGAKLSIVSRYVPAAYASEWLVGFGGGLWTDNETDGSRYRPTEIEFCYTLPGSTNGGGGTNSDAGSAGNDDDAGTSSGGTDEGSSDDAGSGGGKTW